MRSGISLYPFMAGAATLTTTIASTYIKFLGLPGEWSKSLWTPSVQKITKNQ